MGLFWTRTDQRASTPSETQALSRHQSTYAFEIGRRNTDVSQARKSSAVPGGAMWPCREGRELWDTEELREVGQGVEDNRLPFPQCSVRESHGSQECKLQLCPAGRQLRPAPPTHTHTHSAPCLHQATGNPHPKQLGVQWLRWRQQAIFVQEEAKLSAKNTVQFKRTHHLPLPPRSSWVCFFFTE